MKKGLKILTTLLLTLSLVSCGDKKNKPQPLDPINPNVEENNNNENNEQENNQNDQPQIDNEEVKPDKPVEPEKPLTYKDSIELFNASLQKMQSQSYEVKGFGLSNTKTLIGVSTLYIYEDLKHKSDEVYFEKISNGEPVLGIGVSFARKAYIKGDTGRRQDAESKNPWTTSNDYPNVDSYKNPYDSNPASIVNDFGKVEGSYINFIINENTITDESKKYDFSNDIYTLNFDIKIDKGIDSEGIAGYKNQVNTMSGKTLNSVQKINLTIKLDKDLKVIEYTSQENYVVNAGIGKITANVSNNLSYKFNYYDNSNDLKIQKF